MSHPISVNVRFMTDQMMFEIVVKECPVCFALIREEKMDSHFTGAHE